MTVYWWIRIRFSCVLSREAVWNSEVFDGDFMPSKNEGKDLCVQRKKKCHRSGYFSHIENFSCEQCTFLNNAYGVQSSCGPLRKQSSHPLHFKKLSKTPKLLMRESTGSTKVSSRGLIPFSNTYHKRICIILFENNQYKSLALNMWMLCQHENSRLIMYYDNKMWVLSKPRHVD